jgi:hypothetical protein
MRPPRPARRRTGPLLLAVGITVVVVALAAVAAVLLPWLVERSTRGDLPDGAANGQRLVSRYPAIVQDQGNTVTLPDGRTLWIFADTAQEERGATFFVTSSAAVSEPGSVFLRYTTNQAGIPIEFLPRTADERAQTVRGKRYLAVWPTGATELADGRVVIAYTKYLVGISPQRFTFQAAGLYEFTPPADGDLAGAGPARRLADDIWTAPDGAIASPVAAGRYVYFTQCEPDYRCFSLRAPATDLADRGRYNWWTGSGWSHDRADRTPMTYGSDHPGRNPPTAYLTDAGVYATVDTSGGIQASTGLLWVAPRPWGPWSAAARFKLPGCTSEDGCYTLNVHAGASSRTTVRVSYATAHDGPHVHVLDVPVSIAPGATSVTVDY